MTSILRLIAKDSNGRVLNSKEFKKSPIIFGRSLDCHFSLPNSPSISRTHASVSFENQKIEIIDLDSSNGVIFNNNPSYKSIISKQGFIVVGDITIELDLKPIENIKQNPVFSENKTEIISPINAKYKSKNYTINSLPNLKPDLSVHDLRDSELALQGSVYWQDSLFDSRQFVNSDFFEISKDDTSPLSLPTLKRKLFFGQFENNEAVCKLSKKLKWNLYQINDDFLWEPVDKNNITQLNSKKNKLWLNKNQLIKFHLGHNVSLHFRYVARERPFIDKTWIENTEVFQNTMLITSFFHAIIFFFLIYYKPPITAPVIDNIPPRFAKLLVEKKEKKKVIPKKQKKKIVKKIKPKKPIKKRKIVKKEKSPLKKRTKRPNKNQIIANRKKIRKQKEQEQVSNLADMFSSKPKNYSKKININNNISMNTNLSNSKALRALATKGGKLPASSRSKGSFNLGQVSYNNRDLSNSSPKNKKIFGKVIGRPDIRGSSANQGLSKKQILSVVNKHLSQVQQCYERSLFDNPNLNGRIEFEWNITPRGQVTSVNVKLSEVNNGQALISCVSKLIKSWKFPRASNQLSTLANIGFPFGKL